MAVMIKLRLSPEEATLAAVRELAGMKGLALDLGFGLVPISPKDNLYVVRTGAIDDLERRRQLSPQIVEAYGDTRISTV